MTAFSLVLCVLHVGRRLLPVVFMMFLFLPDSICSVLPFHRCIGMLPGNYSVVVGPSLFLSHLLKMVKKKKEKTIRQCSMHIVSKVVCMLCF